jgi:hypothetical protein
VTRRSVILMGGPDSGKTNFVGRLWHALDARAGALHAAVQPEDISFVLDTADHLFEGHFAPRTEHSDRRDFEVTVVPAVGGDETKILIPDIRGELWQRAVMDSEISADWMDELERADGALLFVRVNSDLNVSPLDWVTSQQLLQHVGADEARDKLPTQVMLIELIRFLELTLADRPNGGKPRLSVVVSAWDLVDAEVRAAGPKAFIAREYPMLGGRLHDTSRLDVRIFGLSVVGGDLTEDDDYRQEFMAAGLDGHGWVYAYDSVCNQWKCDADVTLPVAWVVGA